MGAYKQTGTLQLSYTADVGFSWKSCIQKGNWNQQALIEHYSTATFQ